MFVETANWIGIYTRDRFFGLMCKKMCKILCKFFLFLYKISAKFLLFQIFTPSCEDTIRKIKWSKENNYETLGISSQSKSTLGTFGLT